MAAVLLFQRLAEIGKQPARDAAGLRREIQDLREPLGVARFAVSEEHRLPRRDLRRVALRRVFAQPETVAQPSGLLRDRAGFLQPGERFRDALARFTQPA